MNVYKLELVQTNKVSLHKPDVLSVYFLGIVILDTGHHLTSHTTDIIPELVTLVLIPVYALHVRIDIINSSHKQINTFANRF